jgi:hypothetical protein
LSVFDFGGSGCRLAPSRSRFFVGGSLTKPVRDRHVFTISASRRSRLLRSWPHSDHHCGRASLIDLRILALRRVDDDIGWA